jgi:hypothetical protein
MGGGYKTSDIQAFFSALGPGFSVPTLIDVDIDGAAPHPSPFADSEVVLDICIAGAIA